MADATVMQTSYDPSIMTSWQTLMAEVRTRVAAAGEYPVPELFGYMDYHGDPANLPKTADVIRDLAWVDVNTELDQLFDGALSRASMPLTMQREEELYTDFRHQNTTSGVGEAAAAYLNQRLQMIENQIAPALYAKFISNNCVFSSLYAQALIDMENQANIDTGKLQADLTVNLADKVATRTEDLLKAVMNAKGIFTVSQGQIATARFQAKRNFEQGRAQLVTQANNIMATDRLALTKAQLAANIDERRFGLDNLKYVISAQGAMSGIHTVQHSESGAAAMGSFGSTLSYVQAGLGVATSGVSLYNDLSSIFK